MGLCPRLRWCGRGRCASLRGNVERLTKKLLRVRPFRALDASDPIPARRRGPESEIPNWKNRGRPWRRDRDNFFCNARARHPSHAKSRCFRKKLDPGNASSRLEMRQRRRDSTLVAARRGRREWRCDQLGDQLADSRVRQRLILSSNKRGSEARLRTSLRLESSGTWTCIHPRCCAGEHSANGKGGQWARYYSCNCNGIR